MNAQSFSGLGINTQTNPSGAVPGGLCSFSTSCGSNHFFSVGADRMAGSNFLPSNNLLAGFLFLASRSIRLPNILMAVTMAPINMTINTALQTNETMTELTSVGMAVSQ